MIYGRRVGGGTWDSCGGPAEGFLVCHGRRIEVVQSADHRTHSEYLRVILECSVGRIDRGAFLLSLTYQIRQLCLLPPTSSASVLYSSTNKQQDRSELSGELPHQPKNQRCLNPHPVGISDGGARQYRPLGRDKAFYYNIIPAV